MAAPREGPSPVPHGRTANLSRLAVTVLALIVAGLGLVAHRRGEAPASRRLAPGPGRRRALPAEDRAPFTKP
ncbi:hypothetical protein [Acidisoma sp. C75]